MTESFGIDGICRCCHAQGTFKSLSETHTAEGRQEIYYNIIQETLNIEIKPIPTMDGYSICNICIPRLLAANEFRQQVLTCEKVIKQYYNDNKDGIISKEIKEEFQLQDGMQF